MDSGWHRLADLWDRSTGGANVAAEPHLETSNLWFSGPRPAGMSEAAKWFKESIQSTNTSLALFYVGGPGAGKSHAAAEIVQEFEPVDKINDGLAHRKYKYRSGTNNITLINDATIRDFEAKGELAGDISGMLQNGNHLIACINRGVLVEELATERNYADLDYLSRIVLEWLHNPEQGPDPSKIEIEPNGTEYLSSANVFVEGKLKATLVAVYVDTCSLFETAPTVNINVRNDRNIFSSTSYQIEQLPNRSNLAVEKMPAGEVLAMVISDISNQFTNLDGIDPISANLKTLSTTEAKKGILSILRGSEIVSGQLLTYRDLWGAIARCILGTLPEHGSKNESLDRMSKFADEEISEFSDIKKFAESRFSQALYRPAEMYDTQAHLKRHPVLKLTAKIDPVIDSRKNRDNGTNETISIAELINDAFSRYGESYSPLGFLMEGELGRYKKMVMPFDWMIDNLFQVQLDKQRDNPRAIRSATSWYATYLRRFFSTIQGMPAYQEELSAWTDAWNMSPLIPSQLESGLETLLIPRRHANAVNSKSVLPILESRAVPIIGNLKSPRLAITADNVQLSTTRSGEKIFLNLSDRGTIVGKMSLDFALVREALASSCNEPAITEVSGMTAPRLERFRATRLVSHQGDEKKYVIAHDNIETPFTIDKVGKE